MLEAEHVGFGASGRNGGWVSALWPVGGRHARPHGTGARRPWRTCAALRDTVDEVGRVDAEEGLGARVRQGRGAGRGPHAGAGGPGPGRRRARGRRGATARSGWMPPPTRERLDVAGARGATFTPNCARVHPRRLVDGLAAAVRRLRRADRRGGPRDARSATGSSCLDRRPAGHGRRTSCVATEGWTGTLAGMSRRDRAGLLAHGRHRADRRPSAGTAIGLAGREVFADHGHVVIYGQRTDDGRIAFGGRGRALPLGLARSGPSSTRSPASSTRCARRCATCSPSSTASRFTHAWGGPLGIARDWHPSVGLGPGDPGSAGPAATSVTASRRATSPAAPWPTWSRGRDTALTTLPWVGHRSPRWEPEPLRWLGINAGLRLAHARPTARRSRPVARPGSAPCSTGSPPLGSPRARDREPARLAHRAARAARSAGCGCRTSTSPVTRPHCSAAPTSRGMVVLGGRIPPALDAHLRGARRPGLPDRPAGARSTPTARRSTSRASCTPGWPSTATRRRPTPGVPLVARRRRPARRLRHPAAGDPRRLGHRRARRVPRRRPTVGVMGGHALARGTDAVCRCRAPRSPARDRGPRGGDRRRARAPWRPPTSAPSPPTRRRCGCRLERLADGAVVLPDIGAWAALALAVHDDLMHAGRRTPGCQHRHPDLVLRPRAAQRVLRRHRQVLLQRAARGRPAGPVDRRARRARGRRRHRAGDLPGGHAAVLRARGRRAAGRRARRARALDPGGAGLAGPDRAGLAGGRWPGSCTWSTRSTRRPTSSLPPGTPEKHFRNSSVALRCAHFPVESTKSTNPENRDCRGPSCARLGLPLQGLR